MSDKWKLEGTIFDACVCTTLCPCVYLQTPTDPNHCVASLAAKINKGSMGKTKLDGLHFAMTIYSKGNPLTAGIEKASMVIDEKASKEQREALGQIFGGQAGGLFAMLGKVIKNPPHVSFGKFEYSNDGKSWSVKAGSDVEVRAGYLKPPKDMPFPDRPMKAVAMDPFFGPSLEKVVGISEKFRANTGGISAEVSGKYSSSGNFVYEGP